MKKFIALFLAFSILALSGGLFAKERKGADLIIQKTDGTQVRGELIAVKQTSLLLLDRDTGADVTVDIGDVGVITIVRKWKAEKGFLYGSIIGGVGGVGLVALGVLVSGAGEEVRWGPIAAVSVGMVLATGAIGALISGLSSFDKTIQIEGKSESEIQDTLEELRKKARIKNYQ